MAKLIPNNREALNLYIRATISNIDSRLRFEKENEFTYLYKRTSTIYHIIIDNIEKLSIESLNYYSDALKSIKIIHDTLKPYELRKKEEENLINKLNRIEKEIQQFNQTKNKPRFINLNIEKKQQIKKEDSKITQVVIAAHESATKPPKDCNKLAEIIYNKIDELRSRFSYAPIQILFTMRDAKDTKYCKKAFNKEDLNTRIKYIQANLNKLSTLYQAVSNTFENLLDYLQKFYSKDVTEEDLNTSNTLINRIIFIVKQLDKCYYTLIEEGKITELYNDTLNSTEATIKYFDELFTNNERIKLS